MERLFYATHHFSGFREGNIAILDDADPQDAGLISTGYLKEIEEPERAESVQGEDRP